MLKLISLILSLNFATERQEVDSVVAIIEGDIITKRELNKKAQAYLEQNERATQEQRSDILRRVLDIEIGERLISKEIEQNKARLGVTDKDIEKATQEVMRMNNLNKDQLQVALYGQGYTWKEYQDKLREQLERARLVQFKIQSRVQIKDADVKKRCGERSQLQKTEEQICAAHILMQVKNTNSKEEVEKKRQRANQILAELRAGSDFAAAALKYSDDKSTPDGNLGCFHRGEMVDAFETVAFALARGEISQVVRTNFGFHIIKMLDKKVATKTGSNCEDETALETYRNELYQEEFENQMNVWLLELRRKSFVEIRDLS